MLDIISSNADLKTIVGVGAAAVTVFSVSLTVPKVGPVRALFLGWKSVFNKAQPQSVRKREIEKLSQSLKIYARGLYFVVLGGKGYGKSCMIDTALSGMKGVVRVEIKSGEDMDAISNKVKSKITNYRFNCFNLNAATHRVLWFYNIFFHKPPVVVITVPECEPGDEYTCVSAAVRFLVTDFHLRVIVVGSLNSISPVLMQSGRQRMLFVNLMERDQLEGIPEFSHLIYFLRSHGLDDAVFSVLGGSPLDYVKLNTLLTKLQVNNTATDVMIQEIKTHIQGVLRQALEDHILASSTNTKAIIKVFREKKILKIATADLEEMGLMLDYPNKVFQESTRSGDKLLEPASPAIGLILSNEIYEVEGVDELMKNHFFKV